MFGDRLEEYKVNRTKPILEQLDEINQLGNTVGQGTETGVWLFWEKVIREKIALDTVFIYSDMQAGHGGLFVDTDNVEKLQEYDACLHQHYTPYVDVLTLVKTYRERVKPDVNLFSVQVAGYNNSILPDILYRGAILSGWTGKESKLAYEMIRVWDSVEGK